MRRTDREMKDAVFDQIMLDLLRDHPDNRLAFEYLTGYYLLTRQRAKLVENLYRLRDLGYDRLPRHYAEALLIESSLTRKPIAMLGWTIGPAAREPLQQIATAMRGQGSQQAAFQAMAPRFGDTYAFYSIFNVTGAK